MSAKKSMATLEGNKKKNEVINSKLIFGVKNAFNSPIYLLFSDTKIHALNFFFPHNMTNSNSLSPALFETRDRREREREMVLLFIGVLFGVIRFESCVLLC